MAEMQLGDYKRGWERYEKRFQCSKSAKILIAQPSCHLWNGEKLKKNDQLLVVSEQGLGDTIQFMRYIPALRNEGISVSFCAQSKLHTLIRASGIDTSPLTPEQAHNVKEGQWIPLLSVPKHLGVCPNKPISTDPYAGTSHELVEKWKAFLQLKDDPLLESIGKAILIMRRQTQSAAHYP